VTTWADQAADLIEQGVSTVRDRAVVPVRSAARAVVFGVLASSFLGLAGLLAVIGSFRGVVLLVQGEVWAAYFILGTLMVAAGSLAFSRRNAKPAT
jgi:hypothetical protein